MSNNAHSLCTYPLYVSEAPVVYNGSNKHTHNDNNDNNNTNDKHTTATTTTTTNNNNDHDNDNIHDTTINSNHDNDDHDNATHMMILLVAEAPRTGRRRSVHPAPQRRLIPEHPIL